MKKRKAQHSPANIKRLESIKIEPLVKFSPNRWRDMVNESEEKKEYFESWATTRRWSPERELRGIAGEEVISVYTGIPRHHAMTDGGTDFFKTDVKSIPPVWPCLAIAPKNAQGKKVSWRADYYLCVVVDVREHWGAILGWATKDEIRSAQLVQMPNALSHCLYPWELHEGIPPDLEMYSKLYKAVR
jgi:hypothetical protein